MSAFVAVGGQSASTLLRATVVLCTYNGEEFLQEQLDSLLSQTRLPDQIVICDDVSEDGTWRILLDFAKNASSRRIAVDLQRNQTNVGFVRNFSAALSKANGDVVFLCDQDDIWHVEKVTRMIAEFERRPGLGLLHADARLIGADGSDLSSGLFEALEMTRREIDDEHAGRAFDVLLRRNTITGATVAIRREALVDALPVPEGWIHDEWLGLHSSLSWEVDCLEWPSIGYRQHGGNQIGMRRRTLREKLAGVDRPKRVFLGEVAQGLEHFLHRCDEAGLSLPPERREDVAMRIAHARLRAELPKTMFARVRAIVVEAMSGRYGRYSFGLRSIASDILDLG